MLIFHEHLFFLLLPMSVLKSSEWSKLVYKHTSKNCHTVRGRLVGALIVNNNDYNTYLQQLLMCKEIISKP